MKGYNVFSIIFDFALDASPPIKENILSNILINIKIIINYQS